MVNKKTPTGMPNLQQTAFRLPPTMIQQLDEIVVARNAEEGWEKYGRADVVRELLKVSIELWFAERKKKGTKRR